MTTPPYGRDAILDVLVPGLVGLSREGTAGPRQPADRLPAVLLTAPRGGGRSAVLEELQRSYDPYVPVALVACAEAGGGDEATLANSSPLAGVLTEVVAAVGRQGRGYGRLVPLRLLAGLVVISSWQRANPREQTCARKRVSRLLTQCGLEGNATRAANWTTDVAAGIAARGDDDLRTTAVASAELFFGRYLKNRQAKAVRRWYAERTGGAEGDGTAALAGLSRGFRLGLDLRAAAERTLVAALLADVQEAYRGLAGRVPRPLVLLDDAHTPGGERLLDLLLEHRAEAAADPDPFVVVATALRPAAPARAGGGARSAADRGGGERGAREPGRRKYAGAAEWTLAQAHTIAEWQRGDPGEPAGGLLSIPLPPLTRENVLGLLASDGREPRQELLRAVHRFAHGLPLGCGMLGDALAAAPNPDRVETHRLGELPLAGEPVAEAMLRRLVPDHQLRHHLTLLSVAQDTDAARALAAACLPAADQQGAVDAVRSHLRDEQWPEGGRPFVADPFLRALLVHELRRRPSAVTVPPRTWADIHDVMAAHHRERDEEASAHHHGLAAGQPGPVTRWLADTFQGTPADRWLARLWHVGTAPRPPGTEWAGETLATARGDRDAEFAGDSIERAINRLLHAVWWFAGDQLSVPDDDLCDRIRRDLRFLSLKHPSGSSLLYDAANEWAVAIEDLRTPATAGDEGGDLGVR